MRLLFALLLLNSSAIAQGTYSPELSEGLEYRSDYVHNGYSSSNNAAHQFFITDAWVGGSIVYYGRTYACLMRYDLINSKVIYLRSDGEQLECARHGITSFTIDAHIFRPFPSCNDAAPFYEQIGPYMVLHKKSLLPEQYVNGEVHDIITEEKDRYFQLVDGQLKKVKHPKL